MTQTYGSGTLSGQSVEGGSGPDEVASYVSASSHPGSVRAAVGAHLWTAECLRRRPRSLVVDGGTLWCSSRQPCWASSSVWPHRFLSGGTGVHDNCFHHRRP